MWGTREAGLESGLQRDTLDQGLNKNNKSDSATFISVWNAVDAITIENSNQSLASYSSVAATSSPSQVLTRLLPPPIAKLFKVYKFKGYGLMFVKPVTRFAIGLFFL